MPGGRSSGQRQEGACHELVDAEDLAVQRDVGATALDAHGVGSSLPGARYRPREETWAPCTTGAHRSSELPRSPVHSAERLDAPRTAASARPLAAVRELQEPGRGRGARAAELGSAHADSLERRYFSSSRSLKILCGGGLRSGLTDTSLAPRIRPGIERRLLGSGLPRPHTQPILFPLSRRAVPGSAGSPQAAFPKIITILPQARARMHQAIPGSMPEYQLQRQHHAARCGRAAGNAGGARTEVTRRYQGKAAHLVA
jgi:hypothetical protein